MGIKPSGLSIVEARGLPEAPLDAAAAFSADHAPLLRGSAKPGWIVLFDPADHTHTGWRKALVQELAREAAPARINAIVGTDEQAIREAVDYLDSALGVTGQILTVDAITGERH